MTLFLYSPKICQTSKQPIILCERLDNVARLLGVVSGAYQCPLAKVLSLLPNLYFVVQFFI